MLINAQQQIDESENPESAFVSFVKAVLAQMKQWYRKGEVDESIHIVQYFDESGFRPTIKTKSASTFVRLFRYTHLEECMNHLHLNLMSSNRSKDGLSSISCSSWTISGGFTILFA